MKSTIGTLVQFLGLRKTGIKCNKKRTYFRLDLESFELCESTEAERCLGTGGGRLAVGDAE